MAPVAWGKTGVNGRLTSGSLPQTRLQYVAHDDLVDLLGFHLSLF